MRAELEARAAAQGYTTVELTTGARQPEALNLYLGLGYTPRFDLEGDYEEISYLAAGSPGGANFGWNFMEGTHPFPPGSQPPTNADNHNRGPVA